MGSRSSKAKKSVDIGSLLFSSGWSGAHTEVKRESKRTPGGWDTADDVGAINGAVVPSMSSGMIGFDKDSVGATVISCNGDGLVEEAVEMLDTCGFVIATSGNVNHDVQNGADRLEETIESSAIINNDKTAKANFQKHDLDQQTTKVMGGDVVGGSDKDETGEITHGVQKTCLAAVVSNFARGPEVNMKDAERAAEGPRKDKLAVACNGAIRSNAMWAVTNPIPIGHIFVTEGPKELEADTIEGFVNAHMTSRRESSMVSREGAAAKRQRNNNKHQQFLFWTGWKTASLPSRKETRSCQM